MFLLSIIQSINERITELFLREELFISSIFKNS